MPSDLIAAISKTVLSQLASPKRRWRLLTAMVLLLQFVLLTALLLNTNLETATDWLRARVPEEALTIMLASGLVLLTGQVMLRYLRSDIDVEEVRNRRRMLMAERQIIEQFHDLKHRSVGLDKQAQQALMASLKADIASQVTSDFTAALEAKYGSLIQLDGKCALMRSRVDQITARLQGEIRALMRRGNLNLVLGTITTIAAVLLLAYIALSTPPAVQDWHTLIPSYLLRLSLVVFIEVFAFFFLRLYRTSLNEVKYFQNELTNIEAKTLALEFAILTGDATASLKIIDELSHTERNYILAKGETTIDLEKARLEGRHLREAFALLGRVFPNHSANARER